MHELTGLPSELLDRLSPSTAFGAIVYLLLFMAIAALLSRTLRAAVHVAMTRQGHLDRTTISFFQQFGSALIWVVALILYAHLIPVLRAMGTALLAGASIASVVIGLAAQSTLGNLVAGVSITIYRPFRLGDTLLVAAPTGTEIGVVERLSLGYTTLKASDGHRVVLPNNLAASQVTINLSEAGGKLAPIRIRIHGRSDIDSVRSAAISAARRLAGDAVEGCYLVKVEPLDTVLELHCKPWGTNHVNEQRSDLLAVLAATLGETFNADTVVATLE